MKFVVIGGDAAGMSAASKAKRNKPDLEVITVEASQDVSYSACGMPYNIAEPERKMDDLIVRNAEVFRSKQGIDLRLGHKAVSIDRSNKKIICEVEGNGKAEISYDKLLIAAGARPIRPELPGIDLPGVMALKSLEDGRAIKQFLGEKTVKKVLIVGMGYIGLEMAEAFHARGAEVTMVKPGQRLLAFMPEEMAELVKQELSNKGVQCFPGVAVNSLHDDGAGIKVCLSSGDIQVDLVLVSVGITPNSELAAGAA
ncbi:MAG: FAD-dependent oxidoreductase, partial [Pseudomonadota bacterium]